MKKIVLNISDNTYEKLRLEAILEKKSVQDILKDRIFYKSFPVEVEEAFGEWMEKEVNKIMGN